jgi:flagellar assembly protein FliH
MATIIRRESPKPTSSAPEVRRVSFDLQDIAKHGDDYVRSIRAEAARIIQDANAEAAVVLKKAEQAGRAVAEQAIEKMLEEKIGKQMRTLRPALDGVVSQLQAAREEWQEHWQTAAINLAHQLAERLVRRELTQRPEITLQWMREALELTAGASEVHVKLNPDDHKSLAAQAAEIAKTISGVAPATITPDANISLGGCRVETKFGAIDMQLETQLAQLAEEWR